MIHTSFALHRPVTTIMVSAAVATIGLMAARLLPLEQFPDITFPFMGVSIPYPGSTPEEIEEEITRPVEDALATLSGIREIRSTSSGDEAQFEIEFDWGTDAEAAGFEVRTKLDAIRHDLPPAANRILMFRASSADQSVLTIRLSADEDLSSQYEMLERTLKKPIERVDGVARVELAGVEPREVRVLVDAGRIAAHHIDVRELAAQLQRANFSVSAGQLTDGRQRFTVRPIGELRSIEELRNLVIGPDLRLRDVAEVALITPELTTRRHLDGRPAVGLDVFKSSQANVIQVADEVLKVLERARELPQMQGITIYVIDNQASSIRSSLADVGEAGLIGAVLALIVLYLFLRHWPTTLIVSLAVPLSLLVTLAAMYFLDLSINVMTMMGMMLAIGMLVDNAVVVTESVFRHRQLDPGRPVAATLAGVREVGVATLAGTATSVVVFLPILFGERNQLTIFLAHVAVPIVVAMCASLVIAQTIVPMLTSRFAAPPPIAHGSLFARLQDAYVRLLRATLTRSRRAAAGLGLLLAATIGLLVASSAFPDRLLRFDMFPQDAGRELYIDYRIDGNHPIDRVEAAVNTVETYLAAHQAEFDIESVYSRFDTRSANSILKLTPKEQMRIPAAETMRRVSEHMPEIIIGKPSFNFDGQGQSGGFSMRLTGESTEHLAELAADVARTLRGVEGLASIRSEARDGDDEVRISVDRDRAAALGITPQVAALSIAAALRGDRLREFRSGDRELTLRLAFRESDRQNIADLARVPLYLPSGERIELGSIANFAVERGPRTISRVNRLTSVTLGGVIADDATLPVVRQRVERLMAQYQLPPGYSWEFGRGVQQNDDGTQAMLFNLLFAVAMIYLVMAAMFESTVLPISIVTSILMAAIGVIWTLFLSRTTFTFMALIGLQILIGVVVNIGIVLVAHINDLRQEGLGRLDAILQAGRDRLRPILMTTLTASLALTPLALGDAQLAVGLTGPSYAPMARAIMGGLAFSAVTSLIAVPVLYQWLDDGIAAMRRFAARTRLDAPDLSATRP
ncbi:MAG: efflux RND transporter permease subunit [Steroidobacteraceae bacterium]|nr:efflux RND transporter permease subunit [Steroidobacteraceae bacterium]